MSSDEILDPELEKQLEETSSEDPALTASYSQENSGDDGQDIETVQSWFPGEDEWQGKTKITASQAHNLAVARHLPEVFEELEGLGGFLEGLINDYEMYLTSVDGAARREQTEILKAMFGGGGSGEEATRNMVLDAFASGAGKQQDDE